MKRRLLSGAGLLKKLFAAWILTIGLMPLFVSKAADWQWSAAVDSVTLFPSEMHPRAFLWVPPDCEQVRGIVFGQNNMLEQGILEHPRFRSALAKLGFAEVFIAPTFDTWQNTTNNAATNEKFEQLLEHLAQESGYNELQWAPVIPIGHSAMATFPWDFAAWNSKRTLAILSIHGDAPLTHLTGNGRANAAWGGRNIDGIPGLMVMGEYEWWEDRLTPIFDFKRKYPETPVALLCDAGNGHFNSSDRLVNFLVMFIRKAAEERLPEKWPPNETPGLKSVEPRKGWLVDRWRPGELPIALAARFERYKGNQAEAFWCFDREMARDTEEYYAGQRGKLPELVDFVQNGRTVAVNPKAFELIRLKFPPLDESLIFHLEGTFLNTVPPGAPEKWSGLTNGAPIGHARSEGPVVLSRISGPVEQLSPDTFAIRFNRLSMPFDGRMGDIWLLAKYPGDAKYKSAVEQALMKIPFRLTEGASQSIVFPKIPDQKAGAKSLELKAVSSAGVPVYYYAREGPVEISGNRLVFTKIPIRAKFPIPVTVVAWQYGRTTEPKLQSAEQIVQTFNILK